MYISMRRLCMRYSIMMYERITHKNFERGIHRLCRRHREKKNQQQHEADITHGHRWPNNIANGRYAVLKITYTVRPFLKYTYVMCVLYHIYLLYLMKVYRIKERKNSCSLKTVNHFFCFLHLSLVAHLVRTVTTNPWRHHFVEDSINYNFGDSLAFVF